LTEQERLVARVRDLCRRDPRVDAALMYGSLAQGEGDAHSDIEFWLFLATDAVPIEPWTWCRQIAPTTHLVRNEFGAHVAFFEGLVRGEFHFATVDDIAVVGTWPARGAPVDHMIVTDRHDRLRPVLERLPLRAVPPGSWDDIDRLCGRFANWLVLAHHVAARGERLRALDALSHVQRHLLWMARLDESRTEHWLTPSRRAEAELAAPTIEALRRAATGGEEAAIRAAWSYGRGCWIRLARRHGRPVPLALFAELDHALAVRP
jgi:lincosamide nucleotidyltransferase